MGRLTRTAIKLAEIANVNIKDDMPYIGRSAFAHKGGMHIDGVNKAAHSFEHIDPELVGKIRQLSRLKYGQDRSVIESEIIQRGKINF